MTAWIRGTLLISSIMHNGTLCALVQMNLRYTSQSSYAPSTTPIRRPWASHTQWCALVPPTCMRSTTPHAAQCGPELFPLPHCQASGAARLSDPAHTPQHATVSDIPARPLALGPSFPSSGHPFNIQY
ncbi:hypothetical protein L227DRAFT_318161 [Lentinus tigrinus ALCF2SS1-6]|uniref:Secreted protein n=1 Tax=Lentinus tigrinus ALCF2SS1-6 TaxID=1328759 RepID=A0A5C2SRV6_9APHY|nr:hypothetical protein L227DRAFT_318161 [Lentinus tigrinus ALCF2SS1-6]